VALKNYAVDVDESDPSVADLVSTVQNADVDGFRQALTLLKDAKTKASLPPEHLTRLVSMADSIWVDVAAILSTMPYSMTTVALPGPFTVNVPQQWPLAVDDGKKLSVVLAGVASMRGSDLYATMPIAASAGDLVASSLTIDGRGHANITFPSPSGTGLCLDKPPAKPTPGAIVCAPERLRFCRAPARWELTQEAEMNALQAAASAPPNDPVKPLRQQGCWDIAVQYRIASEVKPTPVPRQAPSSDVSFGSVRNHVSAPRVLRLSVRSQTCWCGCRSWHSAHRSTMRSLVASRQNVESVMVAQVISSGPPISRSSWRLAGTERLAP
jgi:hypothetical protein